MPRFRITGSVVASKWLGVFEADSLEEAIEKALKSRAGHVRVCHQCANELSDPQIEDADGEQVADDTPLEVAD